MGFRDRVREQLAKGLGLGGSGPKDDRPGFLSRLRSTVEGLIPGKSAPTSPESTQSNAPTTDPALYDIRMYNAPSPDVAEVVIRRAGKLRRKLLMSYNGDFRTVEPYRLVRSEAGNNILKAFCGLHGKVESFRVDRIQAIGMTDETFQEPAPYYLG